MKFSNRNGGRLIAGCGPFNLTSGHDAAIDVSDRTDLN
jgi:hypothetical protein